MKALAEDRSQHRHIVSLRTWVLVGVTLVAVTCLGVASAQPDTIASAWAISAIESWPMPVSPILPLDIASSSDGRTFVADGYSRLVRAYSPNGFTVRFLRPSVSPGGLIAIPVALDADPSTDNLYVVWSMLSEDGSPAQGLLERRDSEGLVSDSALLPGGTSFDIAVQATTGTLFVLRDGTVARRDLASLDERETLYLSINPSLARVAAFADGGIAVAAPKGQQILFMNSAGDQIRTESFRSYVPAAVDVAPNGELLALLVTSNSYDPRGVLFSRYSSDGSQVGVVRSGEYGVAGPPHAEWPWAIDVSDSSILLSTVGMVGQTSRFTVYRLVPGSNELVLTGGVLLPEYDPELGTAGLTGDSIALAQDVDGTALVVDSRTGALVRFLEDGSPDLVSYAPEGVIDFALDSAGRLFASTASDRLLGFRLRDDGLHRDWDTECECKLGGRLAAAGDTLYVTRAIPRHLVVFDSDVGTYQRHIELPGSAGLWPSDVALTAAGQIVTSDLVGAKLHMWSPNGELLQEWPAGVLAGPKRTAIGQLADGSEAVLTVNADGFVEAFSVEHGGLIARWRPTLSDGSPIVVGDLSVGRSGRVLITDPLLAAVHVFEPMNVAIPTPSGTQEPTPTPSDRSCSVSGDKFVWPEKILIGDTASVTLTLAADCPGTSTVLGIDLVLVVDTSASMRGSKLDAAKAGITSMLEVLDVRHHRAGLVSYSTRAQVESQLTFDVASVLLSLDKLEAQGETNIAEAVDSAAKLLADSALSNRMPVIVLMTDGRYNKGGDPLAAASAARDTGVQIFSIGLGSDVDPATLIAIAGQPDRYFYAPRPDQLAGIYLEILHNILENLSGNLLIDDILGDDIEYVPGSARPAAVVQEGSLRWGSSLLPADGITLTYAVRPQRTGTLPVNRHAAAHYTDGDGVRRQFWFPQPVIIVMAPSPIPTVPPTATATPLPTPTIRPRPVYLPVTLREKCIPTDVHVDVALAIDASTSMLQPAGSGGTKLDAAREAVGLFLDSLDPESDRAAIVTFNAGAQVLQGLTSDRGSLDRALASIEPARQTCLVCAIDVAAAELASAQRGEDVKLVLVLLTDGKSNPQPVSEAVERAALATEDGVVVFTIGLGNELDVDALEQMASRPEYYYRAPSADDLSEIYSAIAVTIPCPAELYWGQR